MDILHGISNFLQSNEFNHKTENVQFSGGVNPRPPPRRPPPRQPPQPQQDARPPPPRQPPPGGEFVPAPIYPRPNTPAMANKSQTCIKWKDRQGNCEAYGPASPQPQQHERPPSPGDKFVPAPIYPRPNTPAIADGSQTCIKWDRLGNCEAYGPSFVDTAVPKSCSNHYDCLREQYCGEGGTCFPKLADGQSCSGKPYEACKSYLCNSQGVCGPEPAYVEPTPSYTSQTYLFRDNEPCRSDTDCQSNSCNSQRVCGPEPASSQISTISSVPSPMCMQQCIQQCESQDPLKVVIPPAPRPDLTQPNPIQHRPDSTQANPIRPTRPTSGQGCTLTGTNTQISGSLESFEYPFSCDVCFPKADLYDCCSTDANDTHCWKVKGPTPEGEKVFLKANCCISAT